MWTTLRVLSLYFSHWKCFSSSWSRTSRRDSLPFPRSLLHEILSLPGSLTGAQHQKGGRMLHPGWVSGLKVKACCIYIIPVLVLAISGAWTSRVLYRQRASVLAPCSPPPERAANRNSPGFSISRRALGFTQSPWGFPLSSSSSPSLEHELPLSPDSWSTYFHGYKHLEMSAPFTDKK